MSIGGYLWNRSLEYIRNNYTKLYEKKLRSRLKNDKFSIICSNCIGGVIYKRLGKQFLSPTINLWMSQQDLLKFVADLKGYLAKDLEFVENKYDYPVARLGDIMIYFNHSKSEQDAQSDWNRRKYRVNYENLFVIMYDRGISENEIRKLEHIDCRNKIVLSEYSHPEIEYALTIKVADRENGRQCMDRDWLGRRTFEKQFDFVSWLNCE